MGGKTTTIIFFILTVFGFTAAASDGGAGICPELDGVYSRSHGQIRGVMAFGITNDNRLFLVNETTGIEGARFEIDGQERVQKLADGAEVSYSALCHGGVLTMQGMKAGRPFRLIITDEEGGKIFVLNGDQEFVYEKTWRMALR